MGTLTKDELEAVVKKHGGLVKTVALRLARAYGEDPEDLIQIGYIGLMKAAQRFEAERGLQFSTYAVPMIAGEIRSQIRDQGAVKMSRSLKADILLVRRAESEFQKQYGLSPHLTQLAEMTGLSLERVQEVCQADEALHHPQDISTAAAEADTALWTEHEEQDVLRMDLARALSCLEPRARQVIVLRYYRDCTQQQVAEMLGISQVQVCRIEKKSLRAMAEKVSGEP